MHPLSKNTPQIPQPQIQGTFLLYFNSSRKIWQEPFHLWSHASKYWFHPASSFSWLTPETKRWNLGLTLCAPFLNKSRNKKIQFQPHLNKVFYPSPTIPYPPKVKAFQKTKIKKQALLALSLYISVFNTKFTISEMKSKYIFHSSR